MCLDQRLPRRDVGAHQVLQQGLGGLDVLAQDALRAWEGSKPFPTRARRNLCTTHRTRQCHVLGKTRPPRLEEALGGVHGSVPQLLRHHLPQPLEALHRVVGPSQSVDCMPQLRLVVAVPRLGPALELWSTGGLHGGPAAQTRMECQRSAARARTLYSGGTPT